MGSPLDRPARWVLARIDRWRSLAVFPLLWTHTLTDQGEVISADCERWADLLWLGPDDRNRLLGRFLFAFPEFRSVYYHRLAAGNPAGVLAARICARIWKGAPGVDLSGTPIGPGLFLSHGQSTILSAERIGANLQVHQGVTVGWDYRGDRRPIIGDDVFIGAGAKVLGAITVGDGARIGANAVVLCDVPPGATAVGVPAQIRDAPASISGFPSQVD
jgi:serine O-acetyltransferase